MRTRARLVAAAAAFGVTGAAVVGIGPAAMAQRAAASCPGEVLCLYQYKNYGGKVYKIASNARLTSLGTFNNTASSMKNNTGYNIRLYSGKSYTGKAYTAKHDSADSTFGNNGFDNTAESAKALT